ncbi:mitochondrial carrier [Ceraceosorus guamensis]|uniref:Mitochondrial carrier n=1 Tax=Ceraceosorus guamensis TaxID=1522189 RepID=A0A316VSQ2_9BASI|nr:mitochondrial carrier [Ceraceosorus guamensis]PWN40617.1 mitochondrial carrier [Ceraceosorus guamensis]
MAPASRGPYTQGAVVGQEGPAIVSSDAVPQGRLDNVPSPPKKEGKVSAKGSFAGIVSGATKMAVGHPFDTIKVRLQCTPYGTYRGPLDCFLQLARKEGLRALYKGATPPLVGWGISDAVLMGTLHNLRLALQRATDTGEGTGKRLPPWGHAAAGLGAGWVNSFLTTPIELLKAKLQMQSQRISAASKASEHVAKVHGFTGPIDCARQVIRAQGLMGLWGTLPATLMFRSNFAVMFCSYDFFQRTFESWNGTKWEIGSGTATFISGGLAAECFWLTAFPADVIKNRMMADSLENPKFPTIRSAFVSVWSHAGPNAPLYLRIRTFYTGFVPCLLRAFPTNASALLAFEATMSLLGAEKTTTQ